MTTTSTASLTLAVSDHTDSQNLKRSFNEMIACDAMSYIARVHTYTLYDKIRHAKFTLLRFSLS